MIKVNLEGRMGNQLFQYCFGRIISEETGLKLNCPPIKGFPNTKDEVGSVALDTNTMTLRGHIVDTEEVLSHRGKIELDKFFGQRYEYYERHKNNIKSWIEPVYTGFADRPKGDVVVHVRSYRHEKLEPQSVRDCSLSSEFLKKMMDKCLEKTGGSGNIFVCSDSVVGNEFVPKHKDPQVEFLCREYGAKTVSQSEIEDFCFMMSFNNIVLAQSTFSWWASFLSDAKNIFFPIPQKGVWSKHRPDIDLTVSEDRYIYVKEAERVV